MLGKWGIGRIHFLILVPLLVGILIFSVATVPSAFAEGRQGLLAYDGKKIAIYELSIYERGFEEVWSDDDWGEGWTQFLQFYRCEEREDYILGSDTETYFWWNCSGYPEDPGFADPHLLAYNPTTGAVQISKIKDGGEGLEVLFEYNISGDFNKLDGNKKCDDCGQDLMFFGFRPATNIFHERYYAYDEDLGRIYNFHIDYEDKKLLSAKDSTKKIKITNEEWGKGWTSIVNFYSGITWFDFGENWLFSYKSSDGSAKLTYGNEEKWKGTIEKNLSFFASPINDLFGSFIVGWSPEKHAQFYYGIKKDKDLELIRQYDSSFLSTKEKKGQALHFVPINQWLRPDAYWVEQELPDEKGKYANHIKGTYNFFIAFEGSNRPYPYDLQNYMGGYSWDHKKDWTFGNQCSTLAGSCHIYAPLWLKPPPFELFASTSALTSSSSSCWYCGNPGCFEGTKKVGDICLFDLEGIVQEPFFKCLEGDLTKVGEKFLCVTDLIEKTLSTLNFSPSIEYVATSDFSPPIEYVATSDFSPPINYVSSHVCPDGFDYNIVEGNCETRPTIDCSGIPGTTLNSFGDCETATIKKCPGGMAALLDNPLVCTSDATCPSGDGKTVDGNCERKLSCPSRTTEVGGKCQSGSTNDHCHKWTKVPISGEEIWPCLDTHYHCPSGTSWVGARCIGDPSCPSGYTKGAFVCYKPASCPTGATKNLWVCTADVILSCPSGTSLADLGTGIGFVCIASPAVTCPPPSVLTPPLVGDPICVIDSNLACPLGFAPLVEDFGQFDFTKCFSLPDLKCPDNFELVGDICKAIVTGDCVLPGLKKNPSTGICESSSLFCPIGMALNPDTGLCNVPPTPIGSTDSYFVVSIQDDGLTQTDLSIPSWIKNTAGWWAEGSVDDSDFTGGISYLIEQDIISIPDLPVVTEAAEENVPDWVRNMAGWWADNLTTDQEFADAIKFLVEKGIIQVQT